MSRTRVSILTSLAMIAFAGNSLLCRMALKHTAIDPATFTSIRMLSGAIALWLIVSMRTGSRAQRGSWPSALALFAYAAAFSFAYVNLSAGMGALLLFGAVQATMILFGLWKGERLNGLQGIGLTTALGGLVALVLPGVSAPPPGSAILMVGAGVAWGVYSLRGKGADPLPTTAGNFLRAVPLAAGLSLLLLSLARADVQGVAYAVASGALTSGVGYAIWYAALRGLRATSAGTVQLSVPVIAAIGGAMLLGEPITLRLLGASAAILGGIALVITRPKPVGRYL
ncbi:MAG: DMT family transporter [Betaproteobacteria bacterium]